jgi:hypothetical protein
MTEFLHQVVAKRDMSDPWRFATHSQATERLVQWLVEQQREEDNVDSQNN